MVVQRLSCLPIRLEHLVRCLSLIVTTTLATAVAVGMPSAADARPAALHTDAGATISKPLRTAVTDLPVQAEDRSGYDRDKFRLWIDADHDGCNTREEVLIAESTTGVTKGSGCDIESGKWYSYYDEKTWTDPSDLDIDHVVPLAEAWDSGAGAWNADTRERYANDLTDSRTLVAVTNSVNRSKGADDPAEWMPEDNTCKYIDQWVAVKMRWQLTVDSAEKKALKTRAEQCSNVTITVTTADVSGGSGDGGAQISQVVYDPPGSDTAANADQETVTISNTGTSALSMQGWTLSDAGGHRYTVPDVDVPAGADVTVHSGDGTDDTDDLYAGWGHFWNNTGDTATLTDASGTSVDTCSWGAGAGTAAC